MIGLYYLQILPLDLFSELYFLYCIWALRKFSSIKSAWTKKASQKESFFVCDPVKIQTWNLYSRNVVLYSVELRGP